MIDEYNEELYIVGRNINSNLMLLKEKVRTNASLGAVNISIPSSSNSKIINVALNKNTSTGIVLNVVILLYNANTQEYNVAFILSTMQSFIYGFKIKLNGNPTISRGSYYSKASSAFFFAGQSSSLDNIPASYNQQAFIMNIPMDKSISDIDIATNFCY
jgi:hypothetical protein